jgi:hypothetical protein
MKTCIKCGFPKSIENFYTHPKMADGRLGKCKQCCKKEATDRRVNKIEEIQEYDRSRSNLPHRIAARIEYFKDHQFGVERRARRIVSNALRDGRLIKNPCENCGATEVEAHHEDYEKPLEVNWFCKQHHTEADKIRRQRILSI